MSYHPAPLKPARLGSLFMSFAFGVIGLAVGINALVKSNHSESLVKQAAAALHATVTIDDGNIFKPGTVLTVVNALIALFSLIFIILALIPRANGVPLGTRSLPIQAAILTFLDVWLFATLVAFTDIFANKEANISATLGGVPLPASIIQATENELGVTPIYKHIGYMRLLAILPWFTFLFTTIASVILFLASSRRVVPTGEKA